MEFISAVLILVFIAGFGTTFIYNQFSGAKDKMNKVGDVMLNGDIFNSEGGSANLSEEVEMINITEADTDWQVGLIGETENYQIEKYKGNDAIVTVPGSYKECPIVEIGDYVFYYCDSLTSITIPSSVTSIEERAFYNCSSLTSVVVNSKNKIYDSRKNCDEIIETSTNKLISGCKNTIIPSSVTSIEDNAFGVCSDLKSITIPNNVKAIGDFAFFDCSNLKSIIVPESVTSIGMVAFYGCTNLKEVIIKGSNVSFSPPVDTFTNCSSELKFYVPKGTLSNYSSLKQYGIVSESN